MTALAPTANQRYAQSVLDLGKDLTCSICLSLFCAPVRLACNHYYCKACLEASLQVKSSCPLCKAPVKRRGIRADDRYASLVLAYRGILVTSGLQSFNCSQNVPVSQACDDHTNNNKSTLAAAKKKRGRPRATPVPPEQPADGGAHAMGREKPVVADAEEGGKRASGGCSKRRKETTDAGAVSVGPAAAAVDAVEGGEGAQLVESSLKETQQHTQQQTQVGRRRSAPSRAAAWSCGACTLINAPKAAKCSVCGAGKPNISAAAHAAAAAAVATGDVRGALEAAHAVTASHVALTTKAKAKTKTKATAKAKAKAGGGGGRMSVPSDKAEGEAAGEGNIAKEEEEEENGEGRGNEEVPESGEALAGAQDEVAKAAPPPSLAAPVPAPAAGAAWSSGDISCGWVVTSSGLTPSEKNALKRLVQRSGAELVPTWEEGVTHVVAHVSSSSSPSVSVSPPSLPSGSSRSSTKSKRTLKYLLGVGPGR
jgi:hypothetical protein